MPSSCPNLNNGKEMLEMVWGLIPLARSGLCGKSEMLGNLKGWNTIVWQWNVLLRILFTKSHVHCKIPTLFQHLLSSFTSFLWREDNLGCSPYSKWGSRLKVEKLRKAGHLQNGHRKGLWPCELGILISSHGKNGLWGKMGKVDKVVHILSSVFNSDYWDPYRFLSKF